MSHQVIITFDLDENKIAENAEKEAGRQIAKQLLEEAFGSSYYRDNALRNYAQKAVTELLSEDKEKIVSEAIKETVKSIARTKAVREKLEEL